jgi:predicted Zn-dependent protease
MLGTSTYAIKDLGDTLTTAAITRGAREQELEADSYGSEFLAKAGYDPLAMINAIYVLKEHEMFSKSVMNQPNVYHGLFGTHPRNDKRLHDIVAKAVPLQTTTTRPPERDFWEMMDGLVFGSESATGMIKDGVYYHGTLRIVVEFPKDWDVTNTQTEIIARDVNTASTGSITVQRQKPPESEQTPEQYVTETLQRDDVTDGEALTVNGYDAYIAEIEVLDGSAQSKKIAIVYKDGGVYLFRGDLGRVGDVEQFGKDFRGTVESFRAMTARDLQVANDQRIKIVMAAPGDTYAKYAKRASIKQFPEETLRVINGQYPRGEPRAGDLIKVVQ